MATNIGFLKKPMLMLTVDVDMNIYNFFFYNSYYITSVI